MNTRMTVSTIAIATVLLSTFPATALSVNLGNHGGLLGTGIGATGSTGSGDGTNVTIANPPSGASDNAITVNTGNLLGTTNPAQVTIDPTGNSTGAGASLFGSDGSTDTANVGLGSTDLLDGLFGGGGIGPIGGTTTGGGGDGGGAGGTGGGDGGTVLGGAGGSGGSGGSILRASLGSGGCITPNSRQIETLLGRHTYTQGMIGGATDVRIVKVPVCAAAVSRVAVAASDNSNVAGLQGSLNGAILARIGQSGYTAGDVVAADRSGSTLVVYVL
jgi:hypothetical protein